MKANTIDALFEQMSPDEQTTVLNIAREKPSLLTPSMVRRLNFDQITELFGADKVKFYRDTIYDGMNPNYLTPLYDYFTKHGMVGEMLVFPTPHKIPKSVITPESFDFDMAYDLERAFDRIHPPLSPTELIALLIQVKETPEVVRDIVQKRLGLHLGQDDHVALNAYEICASYSRSLQPFENVPYFQETIDALARRIINGEHHIPCSEQILSRTNEDFTPVIPSLPQPAWHRAIECLPHLPKELLYDEIVRNGSNRHNIEHICEIIHRFPKADIEFILNRLLEEQRFVGIKVITDLFGYNPIEAQLNEIDINAIAPTLTDQDMLTLSEITQKPYSPETIVAKNKTKLLTGEQPLEFPTFEKEATPSHKNLIQRAIAFIKS